MRTGSQVGATRAQGRRSRGRMSAIREIMGWQIVDSQGNLIVEEE